MVATGKMYVAQVKARTEVSYNELNEVGSLKCTLIGQNNRAEGGRLSLLGYHLTVQEFSQDVWFGLVWFTGTT